MPGKQLKILLAGCGDIGQRLGENLALQHECLFEARYKKN
jgi:hypothetical protein